MGRFSDKLKDGDGDGARERTEDIMNDGDQQNPQDLGGDEDSKCPECGGDMDGSKCQSCGYDDDDQLDDEDDEQVQKALELLPEAEREIVTKALGRRQRVAVFKSPEFFSAVGDLIDDRIGAALESIDTVIESAAEKAFGADNLQSIVQKALSTEMRRQTNRIEKGLEDLSNNFIKFTDYYDERTDMSDATFRTIEKALSSAPSDGDPAPVAKAVGVDPRLSPAPLENSELPSMDLVPAPGDSGGSGQNLQALILEARAVQKAFGAPVEGLADIEIELNNGQISPNTIKNLRSSIEEVKKGFANVDLDGGSGRK